MKFSFRTVIGKAMPGALLVLATAALQLNAAAHNLGRAVSFAGERIVVEVHESSVRIIGTYEFRN